MRNIALVIMLFFFNSCSLNQLFLPEEVDTVTVVKYKPYFKHHRAYFTRAYLKPIAGKQKYRFLYHPKKQELAVVLHRKNEYLLYNFSNPKTPTLKFNAQSKTKYRHILRKLKRQGYVSRNISSLGYVPTVALRKYKGIKTLMIEVKDYRRLKNVYEKAIRTYNAKLVQSIRTTLPKNLIYAYYERYRKRAKTTQQLAQLQRIANKLGFNSNIAKPQQKKKRTETANDIKDEESTQQPEAKIIETSTEEETPKKETPEAETPKAEKEAEEIYTAPRQITKGYDYYRYHASYKELQKYLSKSESRSTLTYTQYNKLRRHANKLNEERLLNEGSLEELITAYKANKNPKYKQRIMTLMKDKQTTN